MMHVCSVDSYVAENPLVCTEWIHMLQQGVGVSTPNAENVICGPQRSGNDTIVGAQPHVDAAAANLSKQQPIERLTLPPPPRTVLHNEDTLREAFRQAELEQRHFEEAAGRTPSPRHDEEPQLNPTVPPIPGMESKSVPIPQRPSTEGLPNVELPIRRLHNRPSYRTDTQTNADGAGKPLIVSGSAGETVAARALESTATVGPQSDTPHSSSTPSTSDFETTPDIGNIPGRIYPLPVPFLPEKTPRRMQPAISLGSQTLPPSIVIAPGSATASLAASHQSVEPTADATPAASSSSPPDQHVQPTAASTRNTTTSPSTTRPATVKRPTTSNSESHRSDIFDPATLAAPSAVPTSDAALDAASSAAAEIEEERPIIQGDRSLPTLLIIICLSTVGVVLVAVGVGLIVVRRRRGTAPFIGSAASSTTARSNVLYGTAATSAPSSIVHPHPTQQYLTQTQFSASQLNSLHRARLVDDISSCVLRSSYLQKQLTQRNLCHTDVHRRRLQLALFAWSLHHLH